MTTEYKVIGTGYGYAHKFWIVEMDHKPDSLETRKIANELDGGYLFGSRVEDSTPGRYKIIGYTD